MFLIISWRFDFSPALGSGIVGQTNLNFTPTGTTVLRVHRNYNTSLSGRQDVLILTEESSFFIQGKKETLTEG